MASELDREFIGGDQWPPCEITRIREQTKQQLANWMANTIDAIAKSILAEPQFGVREGGFCFVYANWEQARTHDREYHRADADAHHLEALRRMAVCRLDGNEEEATWYKEFATWFETKYGCKAQA